LWESNPAVEPHPNPPRNSGREYNYCCFNKNGLKKLPDNKTLLELLDLAKSAEDKAKSLLDLTTEVDEKWRIRLKKTSSYRGIL
jgi:hypothetical protein